MYIVRTYKCTSRIKNFVSQMFQQTIQNSTWLSHHLQYTTALQAAPERDGLGTLICSCVACQKILDLKK